MKKYHIPFSAKVTKEGAEKIWNEMNVWVFELSVRHAKAVVQDQVSLNLGLEVELPTKIQQDYLAKFGYKPGPSKAVTQALIDDITESLDLEVVKYEDLLMADRVIHVSRPEEITSITAYSPHNRVTLEGSSTRFSTRMLRRHRPDGDYSKTAIPDHYFENGWLRKVA